MGVSLRLRPGVARGRVCPHAGGGLTWGPRLTASSLVGEKQQRKLLCRPEFSADVPRATISAPGRDRLPSQHKQPTKGRKEGGGRDGTSAQPGPRPPPGAPCGRCKRPLRGQRAPGGAMRDPAKPGGRHLGVQEGCWVPPGTCAPVLERTWRLRAGQCHLLRGPRARPPPRMLLLLPGGAPAALAFPP